MKANNPVRPTDTQISTRAFILLAGVVFLFLASAFFLANLAVPIDASPAKFPIFQLPVPTLYWVAGGLATLVGFVCFFARRSALPLALVALLTASFLGCRVYLVLAGVSSGFGGYLGPLGGVFGLRGGTTEIILVTLSLGSLAGCVAVGWWNRKPRTAVPKKPL